jgi:nicotinamide phosphoribosyltransferase
MAFTPCNGNALLCTDSYKVTHHDQYPPKTTKVFSYFESRGGTLPEVCFFGLQYLIKTWLVGPVVTAEKIAEAKEYYAKHFGSPAGDANVFNEAGWTYILEKHGGKLPMKIRAVPEGSVLPYKNVLFTVENTDPECFWLCTWFETLLVQVWYPTTVCTNSREQKKIIKKHTAHTVDHMFKMPFMLHDFGFRGTSSTESAAIGGLSHLVNFMGSDTVAALVAAREVYGLDGGKGMAGFSIPASEHSTITSWGPGQEKDAMENMLDKFPTGLVACVSDSFNIWDACKDLWGTQLKDKVMSRQDGLNSLVIRPDSGHPPEVVIKCLELLGSKFGVKDNGKGYKVLPDQVRVIQGDGIDIKMLESILSHMTAFKWATENLAFGSGGGLLQKMNRDTMKCAYKCSWVEVDGVARDVSKNPITDRGKKSKRGRLTLENNDGVWATVENGDPAKDQMVTVYENGELIVDQKLEDIRKLAEVGEVEPVPLFKSSEEWVSKFDAWCAENGVTPTVKGADLFQAPPSDDSIAAMLTSLESKISGGLSKVQLAESLQALNRVNAKLLQVAKKSSEPN